MSGSCCPAEARALTCYTARSPDQGWNCCPPTWQGRFLTAGPSAKPLEFMSAYGVSAYSASLLFSGAVQSCVMGWSVYTDHSGTQRDLHGPWPLSELGMKVLSKQPPRQGQPEHLSEAGGVREPSPRCYPGPGEVLPLLTAVAPARSSTNIMTMSQEKG